MPVMHDLTVGLTKKMGPLKAWQWGLVGGGGIILYTVLKKNGMSLSGTTTSSTTDAAGLYDAGTSTTGTGTSVSGGSDNGTAPQPINIVIQPATPVEDKPTSNDAVPAVVPGVANPDALKTSQAATAAALARGDKWAAWGKHWRTQAAKNAKRATSSPKQKVASKATKKVALPATKRVSAIAKGGASTSAKRSTGKRMIAANVASKKTLKPAVKTPKKVKR